jgi:PIN domain nuclease of toxin-antitoxin system
MNPLLLDTCAAIWTAEGQLPDESLGILTECYRRREPVYLSPITAWELGLLFSHGRLRSSVSPAEYWRRMAALPGVTLAEMPPEVMLQSSFLPGGILRDPADCIIAATAREYGMTVMTRDRLLLSFAEEGYLNAIAC